MNTAFILAQILGYNARALTWFQIVNSVTSGIAIALLFALSVVVFRIALLNALGLAAILGATYAFWHFAGTADIYSFAVLFQILAWGSLVYETLVKNRRSLVMSGILAGLSILAHQVNGTVVLAGLVLAADEYRIAREKLSSFLGTMATTVAIGYLLFGYLATSSLSPQTIFEWTKGYVGDPTYFRSLSLQNLPIALSNAFEAIVHTSWSTQSQAARIILVGLLLLPIVLCLGLERSEIITKRRRRIIAACLLQCFVTWLLIFWWEPPPYNLKYWSLSFVPLLIAAGCCSETMQSRLPSIPVRLPTSIAKLSTVAIASYLPLLGILLLLFNLKFGMVNEHHADPAFQEAIHSWLEYSNQDDVLISDDHLVPALLFWARRPNTLNLHTALMTSLGSTDPVDQLRKTMNDALCSNKSVLFTPAAIDFHPDPFLAAERVSREDLYVFFDAFNREELFSYVNSIDGRRTPVYRLTRPELCNGQR